MLCWQFKDMIYGRHIKILHAYLGEDTCHGTSNFYDKLICICHEKIDICHGISSDNLHQKWFVSKKLSICTLSLDCVEYCLSNTSSKMLVNDAPLRVWRKIKAIGFDN